VVVVVGLMVEKVECLFKVKEVDSDIKEIGLQCRSLKIEKRPVSCMLTIDLGLGTSDVMTTLQHSPQWGMPLH
jgi:hypothetical protein